jgi:hypothetical protein
VLYASGQPWVGYRDLAFMARKPIVMRDVAHQRVCGFALVEEVGPTHMVMPLSEKEYFLDVFGYNHAGTYSVRLSHPYRLAQPIRWGGRGNPGVRPHQRVPPAILALAADYFANLPIAIRKRLVVMETEVRGAVEQLEGQLERMLYPHEAEALRTPETMPGIGDLIGTEHRTPEKS